MSVEKRKEIFEMFDKAIETMPLSPNGKEYLFAAAEIEMQQSADLHFEKAASVKTFGFFFCGLLFVE